MTKTKTYSVKSTAIFLGVAILVLLFFGLLSQNSGLFKGQLSLNPVGEGQNPGIIIEVMNCGEVCTTPSLIVNNIEPIESVEFLVKNAFDGEVVYADYIPAIEANNRYEIEFSPEVCGIYSFDGITSRYNLESTSACTEGTYDFLVSGAMQGQAAAALFTEFTSFVLTQ